MVQTVLAEFFRVLALEFLKHRGKGSSIHELHEYPEAVLEIEGFVTLNDRFALAHLHDSDLVLDCLPLCTILGLCKFQSKKLSITDPHAAEDSSEATGALLANNFVELGRIFLLYIGCVADLASDLSTVL